MVEYVKHDLEFILQQILISEAHAQGQDLTSLIPNTQLPYGVRTVDGTYNNLVPGQSGFGSANGEFPSLLDPVYINENDGDTMVLGPGVTVTNNNYGIEGNVADADPRIISNLIVDQTTNNPAAVDAAENRDGSFSFDHDGDPLTPELHFIPNQAPDEGLSAPFNSWMTLFGQFFDHGLDLVNKGGNGAIFVPLQPDDPLYVAGGHSNFMVLTRATVDAGADNQLGTEDDVEPTNDTTPFVDQNQTYTSHPAHQVFLREYVLNAAGQPVATGRLIEGANGGMATWAEVKAQAAAMLGIELNDLDALNVPLVRVDPYGNFIPDSEGMPQLVIGLGDDGLPNTEDDDVVSGLPGAPVITAIEIPLRTGHAFLADIAHSANPVSSQGVPLQADTDNAVGLSEPGRYDDELLDAHFIAGDGRANENIGLTAVHHVFHAEHNRLVEHTKEVILASNDVAFLNEWLVDDVTTIPANLSTLVWDGERLFQAARFGTEMQYQHLVFEEFARKVQPLVNVFGSYDNTIDSSIVAEFAHTVYRFGHSMLTETVDLMDEDGNLTEVGLIQAFLNPLGFHQAVGADGLVDPLVGYDPAAAAGAIIRGMTRQTGNEIDEFVTDAVRNNLLGLPLDLATINILRGRDTGIPSLNVARAEFFAGTGDTKLKPYESWFDFAIHLKNEASIVNFIAAYGQHGSILAATTLEEKRDAALALVVGGDDAPDDRIDFLNSTGAWADQETGLNLVDFWIGGLAEAIEPFGGMLGSTFNFVFEEQMEKLQDGDRFYYLARTVGLNFLTQLEQNSFAKLIMKNTDLGVDESNLNDFTTHLPGDIFASPNFILEARLLSQADYNGDLVAGSDPLGGSMLVPLVIRVDSNGDGIAESLRFTGGEHVVIGGTNYDDILTGGIGDDTLWGDGGNDRLEGGNGADIILGGSGDDIITDSGGPGPDNLQGNDGNDVITAGPGEALILGGAGKDYVLAGINLKETFGGAGDDFINAGDDGNIVFGGEGNDWIEGDGGNDLLQGDNGDPFQVSTVIGNDVIIGGGGDDDYDSESGDDIMVGSPGTERNEGMLGFDWTTYKDDAFGIEVDMNVRVFAPPPLPGSPDAFLDRFDSVEGLSGSKFSDILRGDDALAADMVGHELNNIALIDGLDELLGENVTQFTGGNIILGGDGSDIIEGRAGNDLIDGDKWLNVRISIRDALGNELDTVDSMMGTLSNTTLGWAGRNLNELMLSGAINPGQLHIVREILAADGTGDTDTAVFSGNFSNYQIGADTEGRRTIVDTVGTDGVDVIMNIERLQFADQLVTLTGENRGPVGLLTISDSSPQEDQTLTVSALGVTDPDNPGPLPNGGAITGVTFFWQVDDGAGVFNDILVELLGEEVPVTGTSFTPGDAEVGLALRVRAVYEDATGVIEQVFSAPTQPVINLNDVATGVAIISDPTPTEGLILSVATAGIVDLDGLDAAVFTFQWEELIGTIWTAIPGATAQTFTPEQAQVERQLRVVVSFTDDAGFAESITSAPTTVVGDRIVMNGGAQIINGTAGDDIVFAGGGGDTVNGGDGGDILNGEAGNDTLLGGLGADTLDGGLGADNLQGGQGNDILIGGENGGNDTLNGGAGNDRMVGGGGNDIYIVDSLGDVVVEDAGFGITDRVDTTLAAYTLAANVENLTYIGVGSFAGTGNALNNVITGGAQADTLNGSAGDDTLNGGDGNDTLDGGLNNDTLNGANGADIMNGGDGNDALNGQAGTDVMTGGAGTDTLIGGGDNDTFKATVGDGSDVYIGSGGTGDTYDLSGTTANATVNLITGEASSSQTGSDSLLTIENVIGGSGNDTITSNGGVNRLDGGAGNDTISSGGGNDFVIGGSGNDTMNGGIGNDTFEFAAGFGDDTIVGFDANPAGGQDRIDFSDLGISFAALTITTVAGDTQIALATGDTILLQGVNSTAITSADFIF